MKRHRIVLLLLIVFAATTAWAQTETVLPAPTANHQTVLSLDAKAEATDILRRSEFVEASTIHVKKKSWFDRQIENLLKAIADWLNGHSGSGMNGNSFKSLGTALQWIFYAIVAIIGGAAIYFIARIAARLQWRRTVRKAVLGADLDDDNILDPLGNAKTLAAQGNLRDAVRLGYIASLRRLRDAGLLVLEADKTNWEYQTALRGRSPESHDILLPATRIFDRVWYGRRKATTNEFDEILRVHDALPSAPVAKVTDTKLVTDGKSAVVTVTASSSKDNPW